jgi:hypothetical protein
MIPLTIGAYSEERSHWTVIGSQSARDRLCAAFAAPWSCVGSMGGIGTHRTLDPRTRSSLWQASSAQRAASE